MKFELIKWSIVTLLNTKMYAIFGELLNMNTSINVFVVGGIGSPTNTHHEMTGPHVDRSVCGDHLTLVLVSLGVVIFFQICSGCTLACCLAGTAFIHVLLTAAFCPVQGHGGYRSLFQLSLDERFLSVQNKNVHKYNVTAPT